MPLTPAEPETTGRQPAPPEVIELVARFHANRDAYRSGAYNETQVRHEFVDPLFIALGWDVNNTLGYAEAYKDVIHEDSIKVGGGIKAPDYCFRVGGRRKFFVEAKKPAVNIGGDISPAFQLRRYAWSAKLPLSVLTDFEEFAVYDCRIKPDKADTPATARVMYLTYDQYPRRWHEIAGILSRDAVLRGSFDRYVESTKAKRGTAEVDAAFLAEIQSWREALARNIALRNPRLNQRELNYAVQRTIDRIIFLRIAEDRALEAYGELQALLNGENVYGRLTNLYQRADDRYNSGLFHFRPEPGRAEEPDDWTLNLTVDDRVLKDILTRLYYPDSPYEFSVLPADILGQIYEQFLGQVIRLTPGHRAVVEDKPEVKKAGGVYYTPTYIVEYIVRHTVGPLLQGRTPRELGAPDPTAPARRRRGRAPAESTLRPPPPAVPLRILDPACGSGSFLLGAYQYLLDWYRDAYVRDDPQKWARGAHPTLYEHGAGDWRLTTAERKRILLTHIYGVDIDPQAVEVTKLSLLLKVLEGESAETLGSQLALFQERALPDLGANIKCGNSLIGPDYYDDRQLALLPEEEQYRINAFDWAHAFPAVFPPSRGGGEGGFDAVIGNPPYVRQEMLGEQKAYFQTRYEVYHGIADLYTYFIERGMSLLRPGGHFGIIVANKWMRANYGAPLRRWLKKQCIEEITDFGDLPVFTQATTYPCILRLCKGEPKPTFSATQVDTLDFGSLTEYVAAHAYAVNQAALDDDGWSLASERAQALLDKLRATGVPLGEYVQGKIYYGIKTGLNEAFVIDRATRDRLIAEDPKSAELIKPFLAGRDVKRYEPPASDRYLILIPRGWTRLNSGGAADAWGWLKRRYPAIAGWLSPFAAAAEKRYDKGEYWWELRACDYYEEFEKPKIIYPNICKKPEHTYDGTGLYTNQKCFIISLPDKYLLGVLNSSVTFFLFRSVLPKLRGDFYEPSYVYFKDFPIRTINFSDAADVARHERMVALVEQMLALHRQLGACRLPHERELLQRQIAATDRQIDRLVYELYGLTAEEIEIVESSQPSPASLSAGTLSHRDGRGQGVLTPEN